MATNTDNFLLKFGFSGKDALRGLDLIETKLRRIERRVMRLSNNSSTFVGPLRPPRFNPPSATPPPPNPGGRPSTTPRVNQRQARLDRTRRFQATRGMLNIADRDRAEAARLVRRYRIAQRNNDIVAMGRLRAQVASLNASYRTLDRNARRAANGNGAFTGSLRVMAASMAVTTFGLVEGTKMILSAGKQIESLNASMLVSSGGTRQAGLDMAFVRENAYKLGVDLITATKSYQQLAASSRGVTSAAEMKELYVATLEMSAALGLTADETQGTIRAFSQMASKGQVMAEELKGQLGERLPGAVKIAADAMGVTTKQLLNMMSQGEVAAKDFLPKMADQMAKVARQGGALATQLDSVRTAEGRLKLVFMEFLNGVALDDVSKEYSKLLDRLTEFFDETNGQSEETRKAIATITSALLKVTTMVVDQLLPALENLSSWFNEFHAQLAKDFGEDTADIVTSLGAILGVVVGVSSAFAILRSLLFGGGLASTSWITSLGSQVRSLVSSISGLITRFISLRKLASLSIVGLGGGIAANYLQESAGAQAVGNFLSEPTDSVPLKVLQDLVKTPLMVGKDFADMISVNVSLPGMDNYVTAVVDQKLFESDPGG